MMCWINPSTRWRTKTGIKAENSETLHQVSGGFSQCFHLHKHRRHSDRCENGTGRSLMDLKCESMWTAPSADRKVRGLNHFLLKIEPFRSADPGGVFLQSQVKTQAHVLGVRRSRMVLMELRCRPTPCFIFELSDRMHSCFIFIYGTQTMDQTKSQISSVKWNVVMIWSINHQQRRQQWFINNCPPKKPLAETIKQYKVH